MITDVDGIAVGHWTDDVAKTGCTVVLMPRDVVASGEVRGAAPGTRDFDLLEPGRVVQHVDAVVLTGGSAFGLAACDGVMRWCEEHGRGLQTRVARIPIVVGMVLFDLAVGDAAVRPTAEHGYNACAAAKEGSVPAGRVGAGTGATYGKWRGREHTKPGGLGGATVRGADGLIVSALVAVNAVGDPYPSEGLPAVEVPLLENTTIGVVATNAKLPKVACHRMAQSAHDGLARAIEPAHTASDGDAFVAVATGVVEASAETVRQLAARAVEAAIDSVTGRARGA